LIATSGAAAVAISVSCYGPTETKYNESVARPLLLSTIWDAQTIAEIGQLYREQRPKENTEQKLAKLIAEGISMERNDFSASITSRIEKDYKTGKTIILSGWILSVTEGRQCALFSLIQPK